MSRARATRIASCAAMLLIAANCYSYQQVRTGPIAPDAEFRARFTPPQDVAVSSTVDGRTVLASVEQLHGRVLSTAGDSVLVRIATAIDHTGQRLALGADATTWVVRGPSTQVEVHRLSKGRSALLGGGVLMVAAIVTAVIVTALALAALSGN